MIALLFIIIFFVAILFSMLGLGGGIFYVPLLLRAGLDFREAAATSLAIIVIMSLTATFVFHREKLVDWKIVLFLEPFSMAGACVAGTTTELFSVKFLQVLFSIIAVFSAFLMINTPKIKVFKRMTFPGFIHRKMGGEEYHINLWAGIPLSFIAGYISVLLGIGGGFAKVPMMALIFGVPSKIAIGTSTAMLITTALTGFSGYAFSGYVNYKLTIILAFAVFFGGYVGSRLSVKSDKKFISIFFSAILTIVAGWMLYKALI